MMTTRKGLQTGPDIATAVVTGIGRPMAALAMALVALTLATTARGAIADGPEGADPMGVKGERISLAPTLHGGVIRTVGLRVYTPCGAGSGEESRCQSACDQAADAMGRVSLPASCSISWFIYPLVQGSVECGCRSWAPPTVNPGIGGCNMCGGMVMPW